MAFEYFLYNTLFNNTLVNRSNNSFAPLPPNTGEIYSNFFIPEIQPLFYYRESGGTIVLNTEENINAYLEDTAPPPTPDTNVIFSEFTASTEVTNIRIDDLIASLSGVTTGETITTIDFHSDATAAITLTNQVTTEQLLANSNRNIKIVNLTNAKQIRLLTRVVTGSASVNNPRLILKYFSGFTTTVGSYLNVGVSEVSASIATVGVAQSGWIDVVGEAKNDVFLTVTQIGGDNAADPSLGNVYVEIKNIVKTAETTVDGVTNQVFTGYTASTNTRLVGIENDINYLSGQTDNKLNVSDFNTYTGATQTLIGTKQNTITGAATTITDTDLTTNRALISAVGKVAVSTVTSTELSYVGGVTSGIQAQLNLKAPLASPALTGTPTAPTAVVGTNTTQLATTAYYISSAANSIPLMDGSVCVGTSTRFAREDHIHPSNTAKANLAGGAAFTGVITVPKPAQNDNTTCVATTSWYISQAGTASPLMNSTVAVGTSNLFSRQDHVHPVDTSRQATITGGATTITASNLTASRVLVSDGSGKVAVSTVTSTELVTSVAKVFGNNYQYVQDLTSTSTNSTSPQTKLTMTTPSLPAGTYRVNVSWISNRNTTSNSARFDVTLNGTPQGTESIMRIEFKDTTNQIPLSRNLILSLSGVNTLEFRYWGETTGNATTVSDATMEIYRVE